jgi:hypothetical protein
VADDDQGSELAKILDALVYAPIGLTLDLESLGPDLAKRGRAHVAAARQIGKLAVRSSVEKLDEAIDSFTDGDSGHKSDEAGS